ncbi:MAG: DNA gyrase subunit A, partial [Clostridia bacterium]|nr:DNA gyrase subunit A [Clostridia bacterium]
CSLEELMMFIKGPDFPTAATIYGTRGIVDAYRTGKGRVMVRAKAEIEDEKHRIIFTEIPYQVNKSQLCESIGNLVKDKRIEGITDIRDESGRDGMRIVVEYRRDANGQVILNQLYKFTQLEDTCAINMLALVDGEPRILPLADILDIYINHQYGVIRRRTEFEKKKAEARAHILEGYKIAIDNIDEVVEIMKTSSSIAHAKERLMGRFGLSDAQSQAIVDMTLGRLTGMERQKVEEELAKLYALIADLADILANDERIKDIIKSEMDEIKDKFGDDRRTDIVEAEEEIDLEDLIERHTCVITMTNSGYIKRQKASEYAAQNRGGMGKIGMTTKEDDFIDKVEVMNSHSYLMLFTNTGRVYTVKAYRIPEASRTAKGTPVVNIIDLREDEKITAVIGITDFAEGEYLTMITKNGVVKKTLLTDFEYQRKGGKIALGLDEGDELVSVLHTNGTNDVIITSHEGHTVRFSEENIRAMGRPARGVRGMTLREGDYIKGVAVASEGKTLLTITEKGKGKRTPFSDFRNMKNRGGTGYMCHNITDESGLIAGICSVSEDDDIMMITDKGTIIRTGVSSINVYSRTAGGVRVMNVDADAVIANIVRIAPDSEISSDEEN